jgi:type IV pilus assembly protein PilX
MNKINHNRQAGVTLVVSLVILVTMTLLGVTSIQSTRTEVAMAGNLREAGLTFNAAEAGLRFGETFVEDSISTAVYADVTIGLYAEADVDPDYADYTIWAASQDAAFGLAYVAEDPKFIIRYLGDRSQNEVAKINIGGYGTAQPGITVSNFRITARGTGQSGNARRFVQSYYGKEF